MERGLVVVFCICFSVVLASDSAEGPKAAGKSGPPDDPSFYRVDALFPGQTTRSPPGGEEGEGENDDGEIEIESEGGSGPLPTVRTGILLPAPMDVIVDTRPAMPSSVVVPPPDPGQQPPMTISVPTVIIGDPTDIITGQLQLRDSPAIGIRPYQSHYRGAKAYRSLYDERRPAAPLAYSSVLPNQQTLHIIAASPSVYPVQKPGYVNTVSNSYHKEINVIYHKDSVGKPDYQSPSQSNLFSAASDHSATKVIAGQPEYPAPAPAVSHPMKNRKPYPAGYRIADLSSPKLGLVLPPPLSPARAVESNPLSNYPLPQQDLRVPHRENNLNYYNYNHHQKPHDLYPINYNSVQQAQPDNRYNPSSLVQQHIDVISGIPLNQNQYIRPSAAHYPASNHHRQNHEISLYQRPDYISQTPPFYGAEAPRYSPTYPSSNYPNPAVPQQALVTETTPPTEATEEPAPTETPAPAKPAIPVSQKPLVPLPLYPEVSTYPHQVPSPSNGRHYQISHQSLAGYPHKPAGPQQAYPEVTTGQGAYPQTVPTPSALHNYNAYSHRTPDTYQAPPHGANKHRPVGHVYSEVATYTQPAATSAYQPNGLYSGNAYATSPQSTHQHIPYHSTAPGVTSLGSVDVSSPRCAQENGLPYCLVDYDYPISDITAFITQYPEKYNLLRPMVPWKLAPTSGNAQGTSQSGQPNGYSPTSTVTSPGYLDQYSSTPSSNGMCATHIHNSAKLLRSTNDHGKWKVIVQLPEAYQITHLETCDRNRTCRYMDQHVPTECVQDFVLQQMMVYSAEFGIHVDQIKIPRGCQCQVVSHEVNTQVQPSSTQPARAPYATPIGQ